MSWKKAPEFDEVKRIKKSWRIPGHIGIVKDEITKKQKIEHEKAMVKDREKRKEAAYQKKRKKEREERRKK